MNLIERKNAMNPNFMSADVQIFYSNRFLTDGLKMKALNHVFYVGSGRSSADNKCFSFSQPPIPLFASTAIQILCQTVKKRPLYSKMSTMDQLIISDGCDVDCTILDVSIIHFHFIPLPFFLFLS